MNRPAHSSTFPPEPASPEGLRPAVLAAGRETTDVRARPRRTRRSHGWLLVFPVRGAGELRTGTATVHADRGDVVLLDPGCECEVACRGPESFEFDWAHFVPRPGWLRNINAWPSADPGLRTIRVRDPRIRERLEWTFGRTGEDAAAGSGLVSRELAMNGLGEIILLAARELANQALPSSLSDPIRHVVDRLVQHFAQAHTIPALARTAGLSPSHLSHRFKKETGDSILLYLIKQRLWRAANLLETTDLSVKEISFQVGFKSLSYFSRLFLKHQKIGPREYRQAFRDDDGPAPPGRPADPAPAVP